MVLHCKLPAVSRECWNSITSKAYQQQTFDMNSIDDEVRVFSH